MREEGSATKPGGTGLLTAGLVVAGVIATALYMSLASNDESADTDVAAGATSDAESPVEAEMASESLSDPTPDVTPQDAETSVETTETVEPIETVETDETAGADDAVIEPSIDEVRLENDGLTVIAGRAAPGAVVYVFVDGAEVASTTADARGAFATVVLVEPSAAARVLTLQSEQAGVETASAEEVILAPLATSPEPAPREVATRQGTSEPERQPPSEVSNAGPSDAETPDEPKVSDLAEAQQELAPPRTDTVAALSPDTTEPAPQPNVQDTQTPVDTDPATTENSLVIDPPATPGDIPEAEPAKPDPIRPAAETAQAAAPSVTVLKSTAEGVELLQPEIEAATSVGIDTIGYSDIGDVQLAGRAVAGSFEVRLYLDNRFVASLPVEAEGAWRGTVPDVDEGIYTLRVDQVNTAGDVTSRIETPFKREAPSELAEASQGQTGPVTAITVQTGDTLWAIARDRYGEGVLFVRVFEANIDEIRDPDLIYPGQVFDLPVQ